MAVSVREVHEWLQQLESGRLIAIDDGGLALVVSNLSGSFPDDSTEGPCFEIGGIPVSENPALKSVDDLMAEDLWGEHPYYVRQSWGESAVGQDTQLGYWDWVKSQITAADEDEDEE